VMYGLHGGVREEARNKSLLTKVLAIQYAVFIQLGFVLTVGVDTHDVTIRGAIRSQFEKRNGNRFIMALGDFSTFEYQGKRPFNKPGSKTNFAVCEVALFDHFRTVISSAL